MDFVDYKRERKIRETLRALSKQRVVLYHSGSNIWVVEKAIGDDDETLAALSTCQMRGWVEVLYKDVPKGELTPDNKIPEEDLVKKIGPVYRLTDSGWAVINRTHYLRLLSVSLSLITILLTIIAFGVV